jgi:hypothetical protein
MSRLSDELLTGKVWNLHEENVPIEWNDDFSTSNPDFLAGNSAADFLKKKLSDAVVYGPRFCSLFHKYCEKNSIIIDVTRHLMALCMEHMIEYCKWARESEYQANFIRSTLLDNDYLRAEVRNGIVIVLIYTFAAMKATREASADMFTTLQDNETGLGIANRFSLKIYNDPFNYLIFLKNCISALIDAGSIPDNERLNQPKKNKQMFENKEEIEAFQHIQSTLVKLLDTNQTFGAKQYVLRITSFWQSKGKVN